MPHHTTSERRFYALLKAVESEPSCSSRQEAHDMLLRHWIAVSEKYGLPGPLIRKMHARGLRPEHGWRDLDQNPCYWESRTTPGVRIYLHDNGQIVMQRINDPSGHEILYLKTSHPSPPKRSPTVTL